MDKYNISRDINSRRYSDDGGRYSEGGRRYLDDGGRYSEGGRRYSEGGRRYSEGGRRYSDNGRRYLEDGRRYLEDGERYTEGGGKEIVEATNANYDSDDDDESLLTNISGMSDIQSVRGYSEDKLPEYAKLRLTKYDIKKIEIEEYNFLRNKSIRDEHLYYDENNKAMIANYPNPNPTSSIDQYISIPYKGKRTTMVELSLKFIKSFGSNPSDWDIKDVLIWFGNTYKLTDGARMLYNPNNFDILNKVSYDTRYKLDKDVLNLPYTSHSDAEVAKDNLLYESKEPDKELSKLYGRDGMLVGFYDILLHPTDFSHNLIQYLLYFFYFIEPSSESILARTGWTKLDKSNSNRLGYNPTAGVLMRLIEVLYYIDARYLYPQCVKNVNSCSKLEKNNTCNEKHLKINLMNTSFLSKLNKVESTLRLKIQKKMTRGLYSTVFRKFFDYKNFNESGTPEYSNKLAYNLESCETILKRDVDSIKYTWFLRGGIKNVGHEYSNDGDNITNKCMDDLDKYIEYSNDTLEMNQSISALIKEFVIFGKCNASDKKFRDKVKQKYGFDLHSLSHGGINKLANYSMDGGQTNFDTLNYSLILFRSLIGRNQNLREEILQL
jgi:hypothetical protein